MTINIKMYGLGSNSYGTIDDLYEKYKSEFKKLGYVVHIGSVEMANVLMEDEYNPEDMVNFIKSKLGKPMKVDIEHATGGMF